MNARQKVNGIGFVQHARPLRAVNTALPPPPTHTVPLDWVTLKKADNFFYFFIFFTFSGHSFHFLSTLGWVWPCPLKASV